MPYNEIKIKDRLNNYNLLYDATYGKFLITHAMCDKDVILNRNHTHAMCVIPVLHRQHVHIF